ncbi:hypothetical protein [Enterovibrio norvegicus]|uniref:hypothetical protein n=1 Tax=Enterovibrio norvegicus TaxID=188144 RepID=UPI00354F09BE
MFGDTLSAAFFFTFRHKMVLFRATIVPISIAVFLELTSVELQNEIFDWVAVFINTLLSAIIAINVHRIVLHGEHSVPKWGRFTIGRIEIWFFVHYLSLWMGFYVVFLLFPLLGAAVLILGIVMAVIACRLCIVFPAISLGKGVSFPYAWKLTKKNTLYMLCVVAITPIVFALMFIPLALLALPAVIFSFVNYIVMVLAVIALSFAYQKLTEEPEPFDKAPLDKVAEE